MAQFTVHRNADPASRGRYPLLLDVQSNLLADLGTRAVVPLCPASAMKGRTIATLTPSIDVDGKPYVMLTPQLAGIATRRLGPKVADAADRRNEIIGALDLLIAGI